MKLAAAMFLGAAALISTTPAFATQIICGQVSSADPSTGRLQLTDGQVFRVKAPVLLRGMSPGRHVRVTINNNHTVGITDDNRFNGPMDIIPDGSCLQP